jgi:hypothetical protein
VIDTPAAALKNLLYDPHFDPSVKNRTPCKLALLYHRQIFDNKIMSGISQEKATIGKAMSVTGMYRSEEGSEK